MPPSIRSDYPLGPALQRLFEAHPAIFRGHAPSAWSDLPAGWHDLVDSLCGELEAALGEAVRTFSVSQIKEKFGTLRFYYRCGNRQGDMHLDLQTEDGRVARLRTDVAARRGRTADETRVRELVDDACARSATVCAVCGADGELRGGRWLQVLCEAHHAESLTGEADTGE